MLLDDGDLGSLQEEISSIVGTGKILAVSAMAVVSRFRRQAAIILASVIPAVKKVTVLNGILPHVRIETQLGSLRITVYSLFNSRYQLTTAGGRLCCVPRRSPKNWECPESKLLNTAQIIIFESSAQGNLSR